MYGYYINLDRRTDRNEHITHNIINKYSIFKNITRFSGILHKNGAIGCGLSHINLLESFINTNEEYGLIMEDDFCILQEDNFINFCKDFEHIKHNHDWDIIVLTPRGEPIEGTSNMMQYNFGRIKNNQTTTGYIIKHHFARKLLENFKEALELLNQDVDLDICSIDQYWKRLQETYSFYYYKKIYGGQLEGYSSILNCNVNYNHIYMNQK